MVSKLPILLHNTLNDYFGEQFLDGKNRRDDREQIKNHNIVFAIMCFSNDI